MARLDLVVTDIGRGGVDNAGVAGQADGHMFPSRGKEFVEVENSGAGAATVTFVSPREIDGLAISDLTVSVPAGGRRLIGPFPPRTFNQPSSSADSGKVYVNYEAGAEANFLVRCFRLPV